MTSLVSLFEAKEHLRVPDDFNDRDIAAKLDEATGIVLDYLKTRLTAIASIAVGNPSVITTSVPHSLASGVTYPIAGTTTTPTVNGAQVVTVTGPTTFTVPVNVTVGQSAAAGTIGTPAWTDVTVPGPVKAAIKVWLEHLYEREPRTDADEKTWDATRRLLERLRDPALA